jgi:hypothetical protein
MSSFYKILFYILSVAILSLLLVSCKSKKAAIGEQEQDKNKKLKSLSVKKLSQELEDKYLDYTTFSSRLNIKYSNNEKAQTVKANIRIKKDSTIWISIVPLLGIEMARVLLTQDSVKFINKLSNQYFTGDYDYLSNMFHIDLDYNLIQDLLMNELFMYPMPEDSIKLKQHFNSDNDSINYFLFSEKEKKVKRLRKKNKTEGLINQVFVINADNFKIEEVKIKDYDLDLFFDIKYYNFMQNDTARFFPLKSEIDIEYENNIVKLNLEFSKIVLNKTLKFSFSIPEKFQRIN